MSRIFPQKPAKKSVQVVVYATPGAVAPLFFFIISLHVACTYELGSAAAGESCLQVICLKIGI